MKTLNQETLIPLGLAVLVIGGGAAWITDVRSQIKANMEMADELKQANNATLKIVSEINARLSRIEWKLEKK